MSTLIPPSHSGLPDARLRDGWGSFAAPNSRRYLCPFTSRPGQRGPQCLGQHALEDRRNPGSGPLAAQEKRKGVTSTQTIKGPGPFSLMSSLNQESFYCLKRLLLNVQPTAGKDLDICSHKDQRHTEMLLQMRKCFLRQMPRQLSHPSEDRRGWVLSP